MPEMASWRKLFRRTSWLRISRKQTRASRAKRIVIRAEAGTKMVISRASWTFMKNSSTRMPRRRSSSLNRVTITEVNISCMFWISLVSRVTRRPVGWLLKNCRSRWRIWAKRSWRIRCMIDWPIHSSTTVWKKVATKTRMTSRPYQTAVPVSPVNRSAFAMPLVHDIAVDTVLQQGRQGQGAAGDKEREDDRAAQGQARSGR